MKESDAPQGQDNTPDHTNDSQNSGALGNVPPRVGSDPPPPPEHGNPNGNSGQPRWWGQLRVWTFIGEIVLIIVTVRIAWIYKDQLKQMIQSNKITGKALEVTNRSYITIGRKDGVVANFNIPKDPRQKAQLVMYFQNSGHVPARLAWGTFGPVFIEGGPPGPKSSGITFTHPYKDMVRTRAKDGSIGGNGESATVAGDSIFVATLGEISQDRLIALAAQGEGPLITGMYRYCDQLGTDTIHLFSLGWHDVGDPNLNFYLVQDSPLPVPKPINTADIEYLPPCETSE